MKKSNSWKFIVIISAIIIGSQSMPNSANKFFCGDDVIIIPPVRTPDTGTKPTKKPTQKFYCGDDIIIIPPVRMPIPTPDKPTKKKLAVISNFDLERSSSAFTV